MCPSSHTQTPKVPFGITISRQCANAPWCTMGSLPSVHYKPVPPQFVWPHRLPADFSFPETQDHHFGLICAERSHGKVGCSGFYMGHELQTLGWRSHVWPSARCRLPPHLVLSYVFKIQYFALHRLLDLDEGCAWHANKLIAVASHQNQPCERSWPTETRKGRNPILNWHILTKSCWKYLLCCLVDIALNFFFQKNRPKESRVPIWTHLMETMCGGS